jgi:hypothetical protein
MYIVAIAWIYVVLMMAISESSVIAGILTFTLYGLLPLAILAMVARRRPRRSGDAADEQVDEQDRTDPEADQ